MYKNDLQIRVVPKTEILADTDFEKAIYDLDTEIDLLSSHADMLDYVIAASSGIACGMLDVLWTGNFDLTDGRSIASDTVDKFVEDTAELLGCKKDGVASAVSFLERFNVPSDGNTPDFGGGLQHHLRDFAHHPTIVGLIFSLLTQFSGNSYGTDVNGNFIVVPVPEKSLSFIGKDIPDKIIKGTLVWFFHLVSDMAGSSNTAGKSGGTGIPGPILSMAKELSVLPAFKDITIDDTSLTVFISKLFNGTLLAQHDENGKIIKDTALRFDLRGELGATIELGKQAVPVIANECLVRAFYFIRRLITEISDSGIENLDFDKIKPYKNPTLTRMLTVATGVFTAIDVSQAIVTEQYFVAVNYIGIGRFAVALGSESVNLLKIHDVKSIRKMYKNIQRNTYTKSNNSINQRLAEGMDINKFELTPEQTEILYNLEMYKTINDVNNAAAKRELKGEWLEEWKHFMEIGFADFTGVENATLHWYRTDELLRRIEENHPEQIWFRLVLLEAMLFEPYYPLGTETDKQGRVIPSKKYQELGMPLLGYNRTMGDKFLDSFFSASYYPDGYINRLRKSYTQITRELNEVLKTTIKSVSVTAGIALAITITAGMFAPAIAVALVGTNFTGLSGAALTNACLAYLGGGAIAAGGAGMAGGTMAIVGGGALLGTGLGAGFGGTVQAVSMMGKKGTIQQSAKLMVTVREIFLNDEHDVAYSNMVYEQYVQNIANIEKGLVELRLKADVATKEEKKKLQTEIKNAEEAVHAMKIAMKSMNRFNSSFAIALPENT